MAATLSPPLLRRLLDQHLLTGLASLFSCVAISLILAWRGLLIEHIEIAVVAPLTLMLVSAYFVRRSLAVNSAVELQLEQLAGYSSLPPGLLEPIWDSSSAAVGWNLLVQSTQNRQRLAEVESRLSGATAALEGQQSQRALDALTDGVLLCDPHGGVVLANRMARMLLNVPADEPLAGSSLPDLLTNRFAGDRDKIIEKLTAFEGHVAWDLHCSEELADGVVSVDRTPLVDDPAGNMLWTLRDVTQARLAQEMRDQFVFTATHELRTPLTNLKAYAETLAAHDDIDVERQKEFCNIIHSEATRLSRFVDELLDVSRMEAGAMTLSRHETDTLRLVTECLDHIRPQIEQKRLQLETVIPAKLPQLLIDKDKVEACLVNLLGNAAKYTPDGGSVKFTVQVDERNINFEVQDTGIGIAPEDLPRMFQKFFRSNDQRVQDESGSGLGLAFTHEIARLHGGRVTVESELNCGSQFTLTLPLGTEKV